MAAEGLTCSSSIADIKHSTAFRKLYKVGKWRLSKRELCKVLKLKKGEKEVSPRLAKRSPRKSPERKKRSPAWSLAGGDRRSPAWSLAGGDRRSPASGWDRRSHSPKRSPKKPSSPRERKSSPIPFRGLEEFLTGVKPTRECAGLWRLTIPFLNKMVKKYKLKGVCHVKEDFIIDISNPEHEGKGGRYLVEPFNPQKIMTFIQECKDSLAFIPLHLVDVFGPGGDAHQNILIISNKTIERFEPHGEAEFAPEFNDYTNKLLEDKVAKPLGYKYLSPLEYCPRLGPQKIEYKGRRKSEVERCPGGGYCVVWTTMYTFLRILNPTKSQKEVVEYLTEMPIEKLTNSVKRFETLMRYTMGKPTTLKEEKDKLEEAVKRLKDARESKKDLEKELIQYKDDPSQIQDIEEVLERNKNYTTYWTAEEKRLKASVQDLTS
jgi:hypothetical protein